MITGLQGKVGGVYASTISLDVSGVFYEINIPLSVFSEIAIEPGTHLYLDIYHHFSDSGQRLFGFSNKLSREFFIALLSIKGLGPALALSLLSHFTPAKLLNICALEDVKALTRIPRVGKTTAESLVFEINRRQKKWKAMLENDKVLVPNEILREIQVDPQFDLAAQALVTLGYKEAEAQNALETLKSQMEPKKWKQARASDLITDCLKVL